MKINRRVIRGFVLAVLVPAFVGVVTAFIWTSASYYLEVTGSSRAVGELHLPAGAGTALAVVRAVFRAIVPAAFATGLTVSFAGCTVFGLLVHMILKRQGILSRRGYIAAGGAIGVLLAAAFVASVPAGSLGAWLLQLIGLNLVIGPPTAAAIFWHFARPDERAGSGMQP